MRKLSILFAVALVLTIPLTVLAGSAYSNARADFEVHKGRAPEEAWGHAIINYGKGQAVWQVSGSVHNLLPDQDYIVEVGTLGDPEGTVAAQFTTDSRGHGRFGQAAEELAETYDVVRLIEAGEPTWSPHGQIVMVAREDGVEGLLQFRGQARGQ